MKYFALLTDSLREAVDSKIFFVAVALSSALIFVVASVSFRPVPAERALRHIVERMDSTPLPVATDAGSSGRMERSPAHFAIIDLHPLEDSAESTAGGYRIRLSARENGVGTLRRAAHAWSSGSDATASSLANLPDVRDSVLENYVGAEFQRFGGVRVVNVHRVPEPAKPQQNRPGQTAASYEFIVDVSGGTSARGWLHEPVLFFGAWRLPSATVSLGHAVWFIENTLVDQFGALVGLLLGIVITSFFVPNMLRQGSIDLLLVKPIRRSTLLLYKYVGGLTFMFLNALFAIGGVWLVLSLRSGLWRYEFLLAAVILTFFFAILYAVSTLCAVLTQSAIVAILVTCATWFMLFGVGGLYAYCHNQNEEELSVKMPSWLCRGADTAHYVLPRTKDLDVLTSRLLMRANLTEAEAQEQAGGLPPSINWQESLLASAIFVTALLGLACFRFARQNY